jgi:hypothetical protein
MLQRQSPRNATVCFEAGIFPAIFGNCSWALDAYYGWNDGGPEPTVVLEPNYEFIGNPGAEERNARKKDRILTISEVFGLLWNCTDILPGSCYDQIRDNARWGEGPKYRTSAAAARYLRGEINQMRGKAAI